MVNLQIIDTILGSLTLLGFIILILFLLELIKYKYTNKHSNYWLFLNEKFLLFGFVVSLIATLGSLFYSEILNYVPCNLCWYQRIFMYPQVLLFGLALIKKHKSIIIYTFFMSLIGLFISGYHYLGQLGTFNLPCSAVGQTSSCSENFVLQFGFVTIPLMAFIAFSLILISIYFGIKKKDKFNE